MLLSKKHRLSKNVKHVPNDDANSSSSTVLYTTQAPSQHTDQQHSSQHNNNGRGRGSRGRGGRNRGRGRYTNQWHHQPYGYQTALWAYQQPPQWSYPPPPPPYGAPPPMYVAPPSHPSYAYSAPPPMAPPPPALSGILGSYPQHSPEAHYVHHATAGPSPVASTLPHAFSTMTLTDPNDSGWVMDTGATNHISSQPGTLRSSFNESYHSPVTVGNGSLIRVTHTGNTSIPSHTRSLHLRDVLVCPSFIKNLISVRRFTIDNKCSVEFDPLGFSVKDLQTRQRLLRCNNSGPLYAVIPPTPSSLALTVSASTGTLWHRRLGHPGISTLKSLASSGFISPSLTDMTTLCHACQLGKHVRLPFYSSTSVTVRPFDIVHSDI